MMQLRTSIFKRKSNSDRRSGKWRLRIRYRADDKDRWKSLERQFDSRAQAIDARPRLEAEVNSTAGHFVRGEKMTVADLVEFSRATIFKAAEFEAGRKIEGIKSARTVSGQLDTLTRYFGTKRISAVTRSDLFEYKTWRRRLGSLRGTEGGDHKGKPIKIATLNRELAVMRRMMKFAYSEGWISRDIFAGLRVIDIDAEKPRHRVLSFDEERRLLDACEGPREVEYQRAGKAVTATFNQHNPFLKAIIILALDCGMRKSEIMKLRWCDVDLVSGDITVVAEHTKTQTERPNNLTARAMTELKNLYQGEDVLEATASIFKISDIRRSFRTAARLAGLQDLRFHDLRRTASTRLVSNGTPLALTGKYLGHTQLSTTQKHYISAGRENSRTIASVMDEVNAEKERNWKRSESGKEGKIEFLN